MAKGAAPKVVAKTAAKPKTVAPKAKVAAKPVKKAIAKKAVAKKVVAKKGAKTAKKVTKKGSKWNNNASTLQCLLTWNHRNEETENSPWLALHNLTTHIIIQLPLELSQQMPFFPMTSLIQ